MAFSQRGIFLCGSVQMLRTGRGGLEFDYLRACFMVIHNLVFFGVVALIFRICDTAFNIPQTARRLGDAIPI